MTHDFLILTFTYFGWLIRLVTPYILALTFTSFGCLFRLVTLGIHWLVLQEHCSNHLLCRTRGIVNYHVFASPLWSVLYFYPIACKAISVKQGNASRKRTTLMYLSNLSSVSMFLATCITCTLRLARRLCSTRNLIKWNTSKLNTGKLYHRCLLLL